MNKQVLILRAQHSTENPYFLMARATAQDERISFEARGLLAYLLSKPDNWKISVFDLSQKCGKSKVYRILKELKDAGYVEYERKSEGRGKWVHTYKVHELSCTDFTDMKTSDVKNTRLKNRHILDNTESTENTDSREKRTVTREKRAVQSKTPSPYVSAIATALNIPIQAGQLQTIASLLNGTSKRKGWKEYRVEPGMDCNEVETFGRWYRKQYPDLTPPQKPDTIQKYVLEYRASRTMKAAADATYTEPQTLPPTPIFGEYGNDRDAYLRAMGKIS